MDSWTAFAMSIGECVMCWPRKSLFIGRCLCMEILLTENYIWSFLGHAFMFLSSVSSMLNALATVVWEDIFKLFRPAREASDKTATIATKLLCKRFKIAN